MNSLETNVPLPDKKGSTMNQKTLRDERANPPTHSMRAFETYDADDAHGVEAKPWVRPTSLEAPVARPGFRQRWIRVGTMGQDDPTNTARRFREGWRPRLAETVPPSFHAPTIAHGKYAGCVGVEGMILCEMPEKLAKQRDAHYADKARMQDEGVEQQLANESHPMMPITQERSSKLVREVKVQDD